MMGSGPFAYPSLGWCLSEATAVPALSHEDFVTCDGQSSSCAVTAHVPCSAEGHCVVACLHLAAIPKEQTGSGFGFFIPWEITGPSFPVQLVLIPVTMSG